MKFNYQLIFSVWMSIGFSRFTKCCQLRIEERTLVTKKEARKTCSAFGEHWDITDGQNAEVLQEFLMKQNVSSAWLLMMRVKFHEWTWVNNRTYTEKVSEDEGSFCAGVAVQREDMQSMPCSNPHQGIGFVCQMPDGVQCGEKYVSQACIKINNTWYIIGCSSKNWYDARSYCFAKGGDLALMKTRYKRSKIINYINEKKLSSDCNWLYAGLRKEDWVIQRNLTDAAPRHVYWRPQEPLQGEEAHGKDCVRLQRDKAGYSWVSVDCTATSTAVCENYRHMTAEKSDQSDKEIKETNTTDDYQGTLQTEEPDFREQSSVKNESNGKATYISITVGSVVVILVGVLTLYLLLKGKIKTPFKDQRDTQTMDVKEKLKSFCGRTIVLFSGCKQYLPNDVKNVKLINVIFPQCKTNNDDSREQIKNMLKYYKLAGNSEQLRILNLVCLDHNLKLPESSVHEVLQFLHKNSNNIEIAFLPKFTNIVGRQKKITNLQKLWDLRKQMVLLCEATVNTDLPGTEVIAVGKFTIVDSLPWSVVDVTVELQAGEDESEGPLKVTGLIARIISKMEAEWKGVKDKTREMRKILIDEVRKKEKQQFTFKRGFGSISNNNFDFSIYPRKCEKSLMTIASSQPLEDVEYDYTKINDKVIKIKIAFARNGIISTGTNVPINGWNIHVNRPPSESHLPESCTENLEYLKSYKFIEIADQILLERFPNQMDLFKSVIEIHDFPIVRDEGWVVTPEDLKYVIEKTDYDIVYLPALEMTKLPEWKINENIHDLTTRSVLVTACMALVKQPVPCSFPAQCGIAVGYKDTSTPGDHSTVVGESSVSLSVEDTNIPLLPFDKENRNIPSRQGKMGWQAIGSTLDFVCPGNDFKCSNETPTPWTGSFYAVIVSALVIIHGYALGLPEEILVKLRTTQTMQAILREMCSHPQEHDMFDGWGTLEPFRFLQDAKQLKDLIMKHAGDQPVLNYWSGKNI